MLPKFKEKWTEKSTSGIPHKTYNNPKTSGIPHKTYNNPKTSGIPHQDFFPKKDIMLLFPLADFASAFAFVLIAAASFLTGTALEE